MKNCCKHTRNWLVQGTLPFCRITERIKGNVPFFPGRESIYTRVAWMQRSGIQGDVPDSASLHPGYGTAVRLMRHPGMFLAGLNLPGEDLNSQRLVRRMKYMDVFHNPVT